ncbi:MAG: lamin tail domain-containing protein [Planctomycetia bacterium]|nr:lamin tail domain-containing protein [Planctomycetia bacterium]
MSRFLPAIIAAFAVFGVADFASAQFQPVYETVAITEFMNTPIGESDGRTWIELYNFGKEPVDLRGFSISDGKDDLVLIPEATIKPGDFAIIVIGHDFNRFGDERKKLFEAEWLGGKADPRVIGVDNRLYLDRADGIILMNRRKVPIWLLGYRADGGGGYSTYLAMSNFDVRNYGTVAKPSINRHGLDGTVIGYEGQDDTNEAGAYKSDVSALEKLSGFLYKSKETGGNNEPSVGSPLKGNYKPKP